MVPFHHQKLLEVLVGGNRENEAVPFTTMNKQRGLDRCVLDSVMDTIFSVFFEIVSVSYHTNKSRVNRKYYDTPYYRTI